MLIPFLLVPIVHALTPYESGYNHGVSDGRNLGSRYMTGFADHTDPFNQGYINGWCSVQGKDASSDDDNYTFHCDVDVKRNH